jgi:hypothetical protein
VRYFRNYTIRPLLPPTHPDVIWRRAAARWTEIEAIFPDLAPAVALQRRLVRLLIDASARLADPIPPTLTPDAVAEKWHRGVPALRNVPVPIPETLKALVAPLCTALAEGGAGDAALHIRDAVTTAHIDAGSLLSVSLARNPKAIRTSALHLGFSPDLVWLIGELASSPLAHHLQKLTLSLSPGLSPGSDPRTGTGSVGKAAVAFESDASVPTEASPGSDPGTGTGVRPPYWNRGYCPFCGSWPVLIESIDGTRQLRCSFCALQWALPERACVYCGNAGEGFLSAAPDIDRPQRRVELCADCGNYTKVIDAAELTPFPLLAIEDLASMDLDAGAMNRGYQRPELFDLDAIEPLKPTC